MSPMNRKAVGLASSLAMLVLGACASTGTVSNTNPPVAKASASPSAQRSAVQTTTDPCQVVTQSEASQLAGTSYGAGKEDSTPGGSKICWNGWQPLEDYHVHLATAPSTTATQA